MIFRFIKGGIRYFEVTSILLILSCLVLQILRVNERRLLIWFLMKVINRYSLIQKKSLEANIFITIIFKLLFHLNGLLWSYIKQLFLNILLKTVFMLFFAFVNQSHKFEILLQSHIRIILTLFILQLIYTLKFI